MKLLSIHLNSERQDLRRSDHTVKMLEDSQETRGGNFSFAWIDVTMLWISPVLHLVWIALYFTSTSHTYLRPSLPFFIPFLHRWPSLGAGPDVPGPSSTSVDAGHSFLASAFDNELLPPLSLSLTSIIVEETTKKMNPARVSLLERSNELDEHSAADQTSHFLSPPTPPPRTPNLRLQVSWYTTLLLFLQTTRG